MQAYELTIDAKNKTNPFNIVSPDDFQVHTGHALDPHVVLEQPNLSLYCLDHANQRAGGGRNPAAGAGRRKC